MADAALLRLLAWMSPSFPVGAYSYSHGIEYAVAVGTVHDQPSLQGWIEDILAFGGGRMDAILFTHAWRAACTKDGESLRTVAELAAALRATPELGRETTAQGQAFALAADAAWPTEATTLLRAVWGGPVAYPVAVALVCAAHDVPLDVALQAYIHSFAANLVSAGVRLIPLGQTQGQRIVAALESSILRLAIAAPPSAAIRRGIGDMDHRLVLDAARNPTHEIVPLMTHGSSNGPLRVGIGGPVGSGKTALTDALCKRMRDRFDVAAITNDIYTREDAEFLTRSGALAPERILGVETGGCPHTAIREDASINLAAVADLCQRFPHLELMLIESGGDNLAATFSPELADITIYVIDVAGGDNIPRKGGPGITRSDLLVINKVDLAPHVGASLAVMDRDARKMRGDRPFIFTNVRAGQNVDAVVDFIIRAGGLVETRAVALQ